MARAPQYVTKKELEDYKKEVKRMFKEIAKKDIKKPKKLLPKSQQK